jgi:site-specific recombinase XerD
MNKPWTVTRDKFLGMNDVAKLYRALEDAKDLAIARRSFLNHVRDYFIIRTLLETGLRVFELCALRLEDFHQNCLIVRNGKGGKARNVLLTMETQKLLREFIRLKRSVLKEPVHPQSHFFLSERGSYSTRGVRRRVKHWYEHCGLNQNLSTHSTRHTYISNLLASGVDLETVRHNAGHSTLSVTSIYSHLVKEDLNGIQLYPSAMNQKADQLKSPPRFKVI